jgi:hypothetical protein
LKFEAQQRRISPTEFAADLLADALEGTKAVAWYEANQRRLALLHKSAKAGLTPLEADELRDLQTAADQRLESLDGERLEEVERMEWEVTAALQATEKR